MIVTNPSTGMATARYYYHANRLGSVIALANQAGALSDRYVYTPYGVEAPLNTSGNPFRYTGRRYDPESKLYYYRARYFWPEIGRFLETDPIGYADQMNLYAYVANNPLNATDPSGEETRSTVEEFWVALFVGVGVAVEQHEEFDLETGAVTARSSSLTFRFGLGAGGAAGTEVHYCHTCSIDDVASGDSFTFEVDLGTFSGEITKVEESTDDQPYVRGDGHFSAGGAYRTGFGAGFFISVDSSEEQSREDLVTEEDRTNPTPVLPRFPVIDDEE